MPYITDATLKTALAARLQTTSAELLASAPHWDTLVTEANDHAYQHLRSALFGRGYSAAQIDAWDRREEFNRRLGICYLLQEGSVNSQQANAQTVEAICKCREELLTVDIVVDGEIVDPATPNRPVNYGDRTDTRDTFTTETEW